MRILLAISGSISFYKAFELLSLFKKEGIKVRVLLSNGALKFVNPIAFDALCESVLFEGNEDWQSEKNHIAFSKDCAALLLAPASINSIAKLANGICDNVFSSTLIAAKLPQIIAPAANTNMFLHPATQKNLEILQNRGAKIIQPVVKTLACKDTGLGALADTRSIFYATLREIKKDVFWQGKNVLITGGGTKEPIDLVRNIGNYSSGKMADEIAKAAFFAGANVVYLRSSCETFEDFSHENFILSPFSTSDELFAKMQEFRQFDYLIMCAAVSDFVPIKEEKKLKRANFSDTFSMKIRPNFDLVKTIDFKGKKIAFKLEDDKNTAFLNAKNALEKKGVSLICLNILGKNTSFGSDSNELYFCDKSGISEGFLASKKELSKIILDRIKNV